MAAVSIILEKFVSLDLGMGIKLTFYGLPLMIVGIMFGVKFRIIDRNSYWCNNSIN